MLQLIGIKKYVDIHIREKLTLLPKKQKEVLANLSDIFREVVIVSTCNRTDIYLSDDKDANLYLNEIFTILGWNEEYREYCFVSQGETVVKHLMEVICGFHSRILGEDQILGQVKDAYNKSMEAKAVNCELQRLFEDALSCGKKFKTQSKLYEIPVSASSIAVVKSVAYGVKDLMLIGYGDVGKLVIKYALTYEFKHIYIVIRDKSKVEMIDDSRVSVLDFNEAKKVIDTVDGIISCTASPHLIIDKNDINEEGKDLVIFDLAVPRDIDKSLKSLTRVRLYDIDDIGILDSENKKLRSARMEQFKFILNDYYNEFINWISIRDIAGYIKNIKNTESKVIDERIDSFSKRCKNDEDIDLAETLIKSTSDFYVNKAINVLKEAKLEGCEEECLKVIKKIFMEK